MPIDFFAVPCANPKGNCQTEPIHCLQNITAKTFSIDDTNGGSGVPAKVNAVNPNPDTDFIVVNNTNTQVSFKAVDWCVQIFRTGTYNLAHRNRNPALFSSDSVFSPGSESIKRCEGFLKFNNTITFIEIKNSRAAKGQWIEHAREKFEETILSFREHHPGLIAQIVKPIIANPSFKGAPPNETIQKRILKDKIGLEFIRQDSITI